MKLVVLKVNFYFVCMFSFFFFCFGCLSFFFNFPVVVIKSFVSLLTLFFPLIIQDWNKNVNVIYFRQHLFSCVVIKYIFKVNISLFFSVFLYSSGPWKLVLINCQIPFPFLPHR